jgi:hypothetical protein
MNTKSKISRVLVRQNESEEGRPMEGVGVRHVVEYDSGPHHKVASLSGPLRLNAKQCNHRLIVCRPVCVSLRSRGSSGGQQRRKSAHDGVS